MNRSFARLLLNWYEFNARILPWRRTNDPYAIWVSEIMAQQTRVDTVIAYYQRWMERFPTLQSLAVASEQETLKMWEGLGYYNRARNLHKSAKLLVERGNAQLPDSVEELRKLPGIGAYSSAAIASIAFGKDEAALDGNIRRVLARVYCIALTLGSPECETELWRFARQTLPKGKAAEYNQALMELGALVCTPRNPKCDLCPLKNLCMAKQEGKQAELPVRKRKAPVPTLVVTAAVIRKAGKVLIAQRPVNGLLGGMWEFPGGKQKTGETLEACLKREIREELGCPICIEKTFGQFRHSYTHYHVDLYAFICCLDGVQPKVIQASEICWVKPGKLTDFPMGKLDRMISRKILDDNL